MKEINAADFEQEVLMSEKAVVDFYSTECPPCEALAPKFEALAGIYGEQVKFIKIFRQQNRDLAEQLGVKSSPTLLFYHNGKQVGDRLTGGIKKSDIVANLNLLLPASEIQRFAERQKPILTSFDVAVLGGGPAGLTAALYLCQAKINTVLIDIALPGGQVATTHQVSNYPGFIEPQLGYMLSHQMSEQTKLCGTSYKVAVDVAKVDLLQKQIVIDEFETIQAKMIVIATGASPRLIGIPGENEFKGKGISYCATCDAKYFHEKEAVIIGGGNTAIEESEFISKFASKITIIHQFDKLTANKTAQDKAFANPKITFMLESEPRAIEKAGDRMRTTVENLKTGQRTIVESDGIFIFVGMSPNTGLFGKVLTYDPWGYINTDEDMQTNIEGIYAVGDVRSKKYRQITTAVADGTIAAIAITRKIDLTS
ncbi:MAG: thioredoxin-disulfide reductase [Bacteroidetes bacterium]|nr:thioredoxin-disulfide reductase [Bacteroidota bacterium]